MQQKYNTSSSVCVWIVTCIYKVTVYSISLKIHFHNQKQCMYCTSGAHCMFVCLFISYSHRKLFFDFPCVSLSLVIMNILWKINKINIRYYTIQLEQEEETQLTVNWSLNEKLFKMFFSPSPPCIKLLFTFLGSPDQ